MAGPTTITPEEFEAFKQKYQPQAPTQTPVQRIGEGLGNVWDFAFGRDPSMQGGKSVAAPQSPQMGQGTAPMNAGQQPPQQTPAAPAQPQGLQMDTLGSMPTGIFNAPVATPSSAPAPAATPAFQPAQISPTPVAEGTIDVLREQSNIPAPITAIGGDITAATPAPQGMRKSIDPTTGQVIMVDEATANIFGAQETERLQAQQRAQGAMTEQMLNQALQPTAYDMASAERSMAAGNSIRPGVDVPSLDMQRSRMEAGLDPVAGAPTGMSQQQQRDQLERGVDPATGRAISRDSLTPQDAANVRKTEAETAKILSEIDKGGQTSEWSDGRKQAMKTQAKELAEWEINELPKQQDNMRQLGEAANLLEQGQIETGTFGEQVPVLGEWARPFLNPDAEVAQQQIAGVIMQSLKETFPGAISNEERKALISTVYNPRLKPAENADLVRGYMRRLDAALKAKTAQSQHFRKFGNLEGYSGTTPRDALMSGVSGGTGGSPIEGDVNVASAADDILAQQ